MNYAYSTTVVCCLGMLVFGLTLTRLLYNDGAASRTKTERVIVMSMYLCNYSFSTPRWKYALVRLQ